MLRKDGFLAGRNYVGLLGSLFGLLSIALPWLSIRATRLAVGDGADIIETTGTPLTAIVFVLWSIALVFSTRPNAGRAALVVGVVGAAQLALSLFVAGTGATLLLAPFPAAARASLGAGVWVSIAAAYVLLHTARSGMQKRAHLWRLLALSVASATIAMAASGLLDSLSIVREFSGNEQRFFEELTRHIALSLGSVAIGTSIAIPLGIAAARSRRAERPIFLISSTVETIPSLALFGLIIAPLSALSYSFPVLRELGIRGVGATPALIALVLYSLLPIVHNTYTGLRQVSPAALDAGLGMGMSRRQLSWKVEYPLALPLIGEGVRTATVQSIGNTAVAALIGAGGLGHFIFQGLGQAAPDLILLGALPVIVLALTADVLMRGLIRFLTPGGLRLETGR